MKEAKERNRERGRDKQGREKSRREEIDDEKREKNTG